MPHGPRVLRSGAGWRIVPAEERRAKAKGKEGHTAKPPAREPAERASGKPFTGAKLVFATRTGFPAAVRQAATQQPSKIARPSRPDARRPAPAEWRGRRGRTAGSNPRVGWAQSAAETKEARRRLPGAVSCRACPGTGRRAGRHRAEAHGRDRYTSQPATGTPVPQPLLIPTHQNTTNTCRTIRCIIMLSMFCIIQDLIYILRIRTCNEYDL